jgi:hypothetical protein
MQREEAETLANARDVCAVANEIMNANNGDPLRTALGLLTVAEVLCERDAISRVALAKRMMQAAYALDPDLFDARYWN